MTAFSVAEDVREALADHRPVVALESTLIAHGLPWPLNLETAKAAEQAVREEGAIPATIAVVKGVPTVGMRGQELLELARTPDVVKASRRDLAAVIAQKHTAATTVSATMYLAHRAGIRLFATGGIGGVHRKAEITGDVSADLTELSRTPVAVVCAGAKSILDLRRTLEMLETLSVPVVGYGTDNFPAFYVEDSGERVPARVNDPAETAAVISAHWSLEGAGVVIAQPVPADVALQQKEWDAALAQAEALAEAAGARGKDVTPFLLARLAEITGGRSLRANQALVIQNAHLAARIAVELVRK
jgi:pseudouridine-5'-phosphate glycosidase